MGRREGRSGAAEQGAAALERVGLMVAAAIVVAAVAAGISGARLPAVVGHAVCQILGHLDDDVSLVTMSVGGNDLGFATIVEDCIINGESGVPILDSCQDKHADRIDERLDDLHDELVDTYDAIQDRAGNARVVIVGYPELFAQDPRDSISNVLYAEDQEWMNEQAGELNDMLRSAAREAGVEFVDPTQAFRGHGIGSDDPWINDLIVQLGRQRDGSCTDLPTGVTAWSLPTEAGYPRIPMALVVGGVALAGAGALIHLDLHFAVKAEGYLHAHRGDDARPHARAGRWT